MKQKFLLTFLMMVVVAVFVTTNIYAQNKATVVKQNSNSTTYKFEEIEFTLPSCFVERTNQNKDAVKEYFSVSSYTIEELVKMPGYLLNRKIYKKIEKGENITKQVLIDFFEQGEQFLLLDYSSMSTFEESYKLENKNDMYIESALYNTADGMLFSNYISYSFAILKNEKIFSINIVSEIDDDFVKKNPEYFRAEEKNIKWKFENRTNNGWIDFCKDYISENKIFSSNLQNLQNAFKMFIDTVK